MYAKYKDPFKMNVDSKACFRLEQDKVELKGQFNVCDLDTLPSLDEQEYTAKAGIIAQLMIETRPAVSPNGLLSPRVILAAHLRLSTKSQGSASRWSTFALWPQSTTVRS